jgi:NADPH:quinone reductase-like Zn-dependent oxidoreductase
MKAVLHHRYGTPDVLQIGDLEKPTPGEKEILIKVHAATINRTDCAIVRASPWIMRLITGLSKPKRQVTGTDFAGMVVEVGNKVKLFKPGDRVWGFNIHVHCRSRSSARGLNRLRVARLRRSLVTFRRGALGLRRAAATWTSRDAPECQSGSALARIREHHSSLRSMLLPPLE